MEAFARKVCHEGCPDCRDKVRIGCDRQRIGKMVRKQPLCRPDNAAADAVPGEDGQTGHNWIVVLARYLWSRSNCCCCGIVVSCTHCGLGGAFIVVHCVVSWSRKICTSSCQHWNLIFVLHRNMMEVDASIFSDGHRCFVPRLIEGWGFSMDYCWGTSKIQSFLIKLFLVAFISHTLFHNNTIPSRNNPESTVEITLASMKLQ